MPRLPAVDETLSRARRRLRMRRVVRLGGLTTHGSVWLGAAAGIVTRLAGAEPVVAVGVALVVVSAVSAIGLGVAVLWPSLTRRELALVADRALGTDELLITAVHLSDTDDPRRDTILAEVERAPAGDLARALPVRVPRHLAAMPLPVVLLLAAMVWAPPALAPLLGLDGAADGDPLADEADRLAERIDQLDQQSEVTLPEELEREVAELLDDLDGETLTPDEAVDRLEQLQQQLEAFEERLEASTDLLDDLEQAARDLGAEQATQELAEALESGDLDAAADAARDLSEALSEATPEEQQQAAEALQDAGKRLQQSSDPSLQQAGEAMQQAGEQVGERAGQQAGGQGSQRNAGEAGQSAAPQSSGLSREEAQQLSEQLQQARELGERLQRDQQALDRAQQLNGAMEASQQRLGGESQVADGASSQGPGEGGEGGDGTGTGTGEGAPGGNPTGAGDGHTWEDQGESTGGAPGAGGEEERISDRTESEHIDDFEKLYESARLDGADSLLAAVEDELDEGGRIDELSLRLTEGDEDAVTPAIELPAEYREEAAEAIEGEQIPPGYREAVKQYFDSID